MTMQGNEAAGDPPVTVRDASPWVAAESQFIEAGPFRDGSNANPGEKVIHNCFPYQTRENYVVYEFAFGSARNPHVWVEYATLESRPCDLAWRRPGESWEFLGGNYLRSITNGWGWNLDKQPYDGHYRWHRQVQVAVMPGLNYLRIHRDDVFPHIRRIAICEGGYFPPGVTTDSPES